MQAEDKRLRYLLKKYLTGQLTADEQQELLQSISKVDDTAVLNELIDGLWSENADNLSVTIPSEDIYRAILAHPQVAADPPGVSISQRRNLSALYWMGGVAAVLCLAIALFFYDLLPAISGNHKPDLALNTVDSIMPGGNKATLTLSGGQRIDLSAARTGIVVGEQLTYEDGSHVLDLTAGSEPVAGLQLETPKGGTYHVTLSDGTKVWLNAASKLKYPSRFIGSERTVELEGEAYFEVVSVNDHTHKVPFIVKTSGQTVRVLGTQFNVSAYREEAETKTTLIEGSVSVLNHASGVINHLAPGKQSIVRGQQTAVNTVDVEPYTAWKNGYFAFPDAHITHVMNAIARWYDIDVVYQGDMKNRYFGGTISRFEDFKTLLKTIELTGSVKFKIEGRRVTVMP